MSAARLHKVLRTIKRKIGVLSQHQRDLKKQTYRRSVPLPHVALYSYISAVPVDLLHSHAGWIHGVTMQYLAHRFDCLGSGWVQVRHGMRCNGLEGYRYTTGGEVQPDCGGHWLEWKINWANQRESKHIWRLVDEGYVPIDWQIDFKSGFRWAESTWYKRIQYGPRVGVDVKVPWELARMQYLPQLAFAYALARVRYDESGDKRGEGTKSCFQMPDVYARECRNQILDFIASNPPRFGVNWRCAMEVAIRIVNWLVAYDLFHGYGAAFDQNFQRVFIRSLYEHGSHIVNNLEWTEARGNHYLADIVGLLFVAAYLPCTLETDAWLAFAVQELIVEVERQFHSDGTNFEASTCYHRLSAELVLYATALVLGLPEDKRAAIRNYDHHVIKKEPYLLPAPMAHYPLPVEDSLPLERGALEKIPYGESPFPPWYLHRLEKMAEFTMHITKPQGHVPQIGDNDSGRLLKLFPSYHRVSVTEAKARYANLEGYSDLPDRADYWDEDSLDHRHLIAAAHGLFPSDDFVVFVGESTQETHVIESLAHGVRLASYRSASECSAAAGVRVATEVDLQSWQAQVLHHCRVEEISIPGSDIRKALRLYAYPDFGLYLYQSERLYLAIRCGSVGQQAHGVHAHNDQLAIELNVDGQDWITDPGTYCYTPLPHRWNQYRSVTAHFAPQIVGEELGDMSLGLFRLGNQARAQCLYFGEDGFLGCHQGYGEPVYRWVEVLADRLRIVDCGIGTEAATKPTISMQLPVSPGYGKIVRW